MLAQDCLQANAWICGEYLSTRREEILAALVQHVDLTLRAVVIGLLVAIPLALLARRFRRLETGILSATSLIYTIPALAMFSILLPFTGLTTQTTVTGLVLYSLTILVRNIITGLAGVPEDVREAARGMGYGAARMLVQVDFPLALPTVVAGLRIATVSTIALATIGAIVGNGGLGKLMYEGLTTEFHAQVLTATVLVVLLAVVADLLLIGLQRALMPWRRAVGSS
ncbi:MAG: ABC transporter permease subunit [Streptosporangiales bacterium]|nr:ABC transporter permease subunit [Streptosporangiales bacterium]